MSVFQSRFFRLFVCIPIFTILLFACEKPIVEGMFKNDEIDQDIRQEINALDAKLISAFQTGDFKTFKSICSPKLLGKFGDEEAKTYLAQVSNWFENEEYQVLDQVYTMSPESGFVNEWTSDLNGKHPYTFRNMTVNNEMFVSLLATGTDIDRIMATTIYGKYKDGWKLNIIHFDVLEINNKTAPEYFEESKEDYEKGNVIEAALKLHQAKNCLHPGGDYFQYKIEPALDAFHIAVVDSVDAKYHFPFIVEQIETEPLVFDFYPERVEDRYAPMISYQTSIPLTDTLETAKENELLHAQLESVFPGIKESYGEILYRAFNSVPDVDSAATYYGFARKINK